MVFQKSDKTSRATFKADFSMGQLDYARYEDHLIEADFFLKQVENKELGALRPYFGVLRTLWINFRPIIRKEKRDKFLDRIAHIDFLFIDWEKTNKAKGKVVFPKTLIDELRELHTDLLEIKQFIGLGIQVSRNDSEFTKMRRSAGLID